MKRLRPAPGRPAGRLAARLPNARALAIAGAAGLAAVVAGVAVARGDGTLVAAGAAGAAFLVWTLACPEHAALGVLVVLPFLIYPASSGGLSLFAGVPLVALVSVGLLLSQYGSTRRLRRRLSIPAFATLFVIAAAAAAHSSRLSTAGSRLVYLGLFAVFAWALAGSITAGRLTTRALATAMLAGAALASVALIAQLVAGLGGQQSVTSWLLGEFRLFAGQRAANIATEQQNWVVPSLGVLRGIFPFMAAPSAGQYTMLGSVTGVWLWRTRPRHSSPARNAWLAAAVIVTICGLLTTLSRQSYVGALIGIGALSLRRDALRAAVVVALLFVFLAVTPIPGGHSTFGDYLLTASDTSTTSSATRLGLLTQAIQLIPHHWALGVGPGLYSTLNPDPSKPVYYAHNVWLDETVELGVAGGLALVSVFVLTMRSAFRRRAMLGFSLLAAYVVANLFDDVLFFPRNGILLAAAFAVAAAGDGVVSRRVPPAPARARPPAADPARARPAPPLQGVGRSA